MSRRRALVLLAARSELAGCSTAGPCGPSGAVCAVSEHRAQLAELYFGRNIGDRLDNNNNNNRRFLDEELTPRFPDGLSVIDAAGQWRGQAGLVREPSKLVVIVLPGKPDDRTTLAAAANAYKARFRQEAVLSIVRDGCVGF